MLVLGLTGGSGAGKGCASAALAEMGIPSLDTDLVSRRVCEKGEPCLAALADAFGTDILCGDGSLDRRALAAAVFLSGTEEERAEKRNTLNRITHFYILAACRDWLAEQKAAGKRAACIDAPLLFESGFDRECDLILGVTAAPACRIERIMARDGISRELAEKRIASQHTDAFFAEHCDVLFTNDRTPEDLASALRQFLAGRGLL